MDPPVVGGPRPPHINPCQPPPLREGLVVRLHGHIRRPSNTDATHVCNKVRKMLLRLHRGVSAIFAAAIAALALHGPSVAAARPSECCTPPRRPCHRPPAQTLAQLTMTDSFHYRRTNLPVSPSPRPALGPISFPGQAGALSVIPDAARRPDVGGPTSTDLPDVISFELFEIVFRRA